MATSVLGLKTFVASDPVDYNEVNDNYVKIDNGVKTAMQGRAAQNLLDNSYWKVQSWIVNQRGQTSYNGVGYTIDRWYLYDPRGDGSLVINDGYISLTGGTGAVYLSCRFPKGIIDANKTYTKVFCDNQGNINPCSLLFYDSFDSFEFSAGAGETKNIVWAALYEGSYTADTLPAYVPKGYAAELAECRRYYYKETEQYAVTPYYFSTTERYYTVMLPAKMRIAPTVTYSNVSGEYKDGWAKTNATVTVSATSISHFTMLCSGGTVTETERPLLFMTYEASTDL